jgi:hypothetical protein
MNKEEELIDRLIDLAFAEDIGDGDHTTLSCIPATAMGKSKLLIKEPGILAGIEIAKEVFRRFDPTMKVEVFINDGTAVKPGDVVVLLDEGGKEMRSIEFADYMKRKMNTVNKRLVFIIGGPYGFSQKVYEAAHEKMSLSRMTFSHQMVRLIFVEQLYRAMTILNGGPYHHE